MFSHFPEMYYLALPPNILRILFPSVFSDIIWKNKNQKQTEFCHSIFVGSKTVVIWLGGK